MPAPSMPVPLLRSQIAAAVRFCGYTTQWQQTQRAFALLNEHLPGFDLPACLLKVAAINQLYGTNVYAVGRMAEHVAAIMVAPPDDAAYLVERIASLPPVEGQKYDRQHWSFASKFAHFFIDAERFPIYDWYAWQMVRYHLGQNLVGGTADSCLYRDFLANVAELRSLFRLRCSADQLDCYLWLAGIYREWERKKEAAQINAEAKAMFGKPTAEVKQALGEMVGVPGGNA